MQYQALLGENGCKKVFFEMNGLLAVSSQPQKK